MSHFTQADVDAHNARVSRTRRAALTDEQVDSLQCPAGEEIEKLHNPTREWLDARGIAYSYNRPDKRSTGKKGTPDFAIACGSNGHTHTVWIEYKTKAGKLDPDQVIWHHLAERQKVGVLVLRSMAEFRDEMRKRGVE